MADFKCPTCGTELLDRSTQEDAQQDHDVATDCTSTVRPY